MRLAVLAAVLVMPVATAWNINSEHATVRNDPADGNYVVGNLTWNEGKGGIVWNRDAPSEDDHLSGDSRTTLHDLDDQVETNSFGFVTTDLGGPIEQPADEFLSEPVPHEFLLNASRTMQLDLLVKDDENGAFPACSTNTYDAGIIVRVFIGERFLAGSLGGTTMSEWWGDPIQYHPGSVADPPPGYSICRYRMPVELDRIPAGAQVRVLIEYDEPNNPVVLGLAEDHRSQIRIAVYPAYEAPYRDVLIAGSDPTNLGGASQTTEDPAAAMGVGAALFGLVGARRGRRSVIALVGLFLLSVAAAGCVGSKGSGPAADTQNLGGASETLSDIGLVGKGRIIGLVHDDLHVPVAGAHLSLLGTALFTSADGHGRFQFDAIPPAAYVMRVDRKDYHPLEAPVTVIAGKLTRVDVLLVPTVIKESDYRPHHHDYWMGKDTLTLLDGDLGQSCYDGDCNPVSRFHLPDRPKEGQPNLVIPGTYETEVIVTWDPGDMGMTRVGLKLEHNADPYDGSNHNQTVYFARESGKPFHVQTNWEMADVGHQTYSGWTFVLYQPSTDAPESGGPGDGELPDAQAPTFKVKVIVHQGVVPLEPAHPDPWKGATTLDAGKIGGEFYGDIIELAISDALAQCYGEEEVWGYRSNYIDLGEPKRAIPPDAKTVQVRVTAGRDALADFGGWVLFYKTALSGPVNSYYTGAPGFQAASAPTVAEKTFTWTLTLQDGEADNLYAKKSAWHFGLEPADPTGFCTEWHAYIATEPLDYTPWTFTGKATVAK